jgi:hypothetical protein
MDNDKWSFAFGYRKLKSARQNIHNPIQTNSFGNMMPKADNNIIFRNEQY